TCLVLLFAGLGVALFCIGLARGRHGRQSWVIRWLRCGVWVAAGLLWAFLFTFGLNYHRPLLFELLGYEQRKAAPPELEALGRMLVESVNQTYAEAHAGDRPAPESAEIVKLLKESYDSAPEFGLLPRGEFASPKPV